MRQHGFLLLGEQFMIFNYSNLIELLFTEISNGNKDGLQDRVLDGFLKEPFESTRIHFSGAYLKELDQMTIKEISMSGLDYQIKLFNDIKYELIFTIETLINTIEFFITNGKSLEYVKTYLFSIPPIFSYRPVHYQRCPDCDHIIGYYISDGVISTHSGFTESSPSWNNLSKIEQKRYYSIFRNNDGHICFNGFSENSYEIEFNDKVLLMVADITYAFPQLEDELNAYIQEHGIKNYQNFWKTKNVVLGQGCGIWSEFCVDLKTGSMAAIEPFALAYKESHKFPIDISNMVRKTSLSIEHGEFQIITRKDLNKLCDDYNVKLAYALGELIPTRVSITPGRYKVSVSNSPVLCYIEKI